MNIYKKYKKFFLVSLCVLFMVSGLLFPIKTVKAGGGGGIAAILVALGAPTGAWIDYFTCGIDLSWDDSRCASGSPVSGACGGGIRDCSSGSLGQSADQSCGIVDWYCMGSNGGSDSGLCQYPGPSSCPGGQIDPPCCNTSPSCSNGATNYPACNNNTCTNGATNYPACNNNCDSVCRSPYGYCVGQTYTNDCGQTCYGQADCSPAPETPPSNPPPSNPPPDTTCTNGATNPPACNNNSGPSACVLPWGGSIASGSSVVAYLLSAVISPATCTSQTRNCTNGTLSGSYTNQNCIVNPADSGVCSSPAVHYLCSVGRSINNLSSPSRWIWMCQGSGSGVSVLCFERKSPGFIEN